MKIVRTVFLVLLALLGLAAGMAKVLLVPEELAFLQSVGFTETMVIVFGAVQVAGAIMLAFGKTRLAGAVVSTIAFGISAATLFSAGDLVFACISLLPAFIAGYVIKENLKPAAADNRGGGR